MGLRDLADTTRSRFSHVMFESRASGDAFALVGGFRAGHHFARWYLDDARVRSRIAVHAPFSADAYRELCRRHGLVVFCGGSAPAALAPELLRMPTYVDLERDTPTVFDGPGADWGGSARDNIRKIKRAGFEYDIVDPTRALEPFFAPMFVAAMSVRHGRRAFVKSRREMESVVRLPGVEFLQVRKDNQVVAGVITQLTPRGYRLGSLGWRAGDVEILKSGAVAALYWFSMKRAAALGSERVLFGGSSGFLSDGVVRHKANWGARLSDEGRDFGSFQLLMDPSHPTCRRFLAGHAVLAHGAGRDFIAVGGPSPVAAQVPRQLAASVTRWLSWRERPGLDERTPKSLVPQHVAPWLEVVTP